MNDLVLSLIFLILAASGVVLRKTYSSVPLWELKRRAERHDKTATRLYKAATYGNSLPALLWLYTALTASASVVLLSHALPLGISIIVVALIIWLLFSLLPASDVSRSGLLLTQLATPLIARLLNYLHPLLSWAADRVEKNYLSHVHTGVFEKDDLIELIERQQKQTDSRISQEELEIMLRAMKFDEKKVSSSIIPRKKVKTVLATDTIGPVLINELHEASQEYFLVKESSKGKVIGTLAFKDLNLGSKGQIKDSMDETLYYLHENDSLSEALHAFYVTNHSMFVVLNNFEEYVGVITVSTVLKELLGHIPGDDFEEYTNPVAVAGRHHKKPKPEDQSVKTEDEVIE